MIENCIGSIKLPLGLGTNFVINGEKYDIPMVTEEPSVIAAASYAAKTICQNSKGFMATTSQNTIRGQIFLKNNKLGNEIEFLNSIKKEIINYGNQNFC